MEHFVLDLLDFQLHLSTTYSRCCERKGGELSPGELLSLEIAVILHPDSKETGTEKITENCWVETLKSYQSLRDLGELPSPPYLEVPSQ
jgi:hypothetical protein